MELCTAVQVGGGYGEGGGDGGGEGGSDGGGGVTIVLTCSIISCWWFCCGCEMS